MAKRLNPLILSKGWRIVVALLIALGPISLAQEFVMESMAFYTKVMVYFVWPFFIYHGVFRANSWDKREDS